MSSVIFVEVVSGSVVTPSVVPVSLLEPAPVVELSPPVLLLVLLASVADMLLGTVVTTGRVSESRSWPEEQAASSKPPSSLTRAAVEPMQRTRQRWPDPDKPRERAAARLCARP